MYLAIDAEDADLPIAIRRDPVMVVAKCARGQQMFTAILDPPHWMVEFQRQSGQDDLLGIQSRLGPKPPPTSGATTLMRRSSIPRISPSATRTVCGVWVEA